MILPPWYHSIRWMSPELLLPANYGLTDDRPARESDRWDLAMVIYEARIHMMVSIIQHSLKPTMPRF